jgi:hypothetical protein
VTALEVVTAALDRVGCHPRASRTVEGRVTARCPAHGDRTPSLRVDVTAGGRLLMHCFAGCAYADVLEALELEPGTLRGTGEAGPSVSRVRMETAEQRAARERLAIECVELYRRSRPVSDDMECEAWLRGRGIDPGQVDDLGLARALSDMVDLPEWASLGWRTWRETGHRLLVPLYDATGAMRLVHARRMRAGDTPKELSPCGGSRACLAMANPLGRLTLADARVGDGSPAAELVSLVDLWLVEGTPDYLTAACAWSDGDDGAPAVLGLVSGSWSHELALRIPDGTRVVVAVDTDEAGDGYAAEVVDTLAARVVSEAIPPPLRWRAREVAS